MRQKHARRAAGLLLCLGTAVVGSTIAGSPASATAADDCGYQLAEGALSFDGEICQLVFSEPGQFIFPRPLNIDDLQAMLVGGGSGMSADPAASAAPVGEAGTGGNVRFVDLSADDNGDDYIYIYSGVVGAGGSSGSPASDGEDSVLEAEVAEGGIVGATESCTVGTSGAILTVGAGAGGPASAAGDCVSSAGPGVNPGASARDSFGNAVPGHFRSLNTSYGAAGVFVEGAVAPMGGSSGAGASGAVEEVAPGQWQIHEGASGAAGEVVFRWTPAASDDSYIRLSTDTERIDEPDGTVQLRASAEGNPTPSVQWQRHGVVAEDAGAATDAAAHPAWVNISGATQPTVTVSEPGYYRAVFTNAAGEVESSEVLVNDELAATGGTPPIFMLVAAALLMLAGAASLSKVRAPRITRLPFA